MGENRANAPQTRWHGHLHAAVKRGLNLSCDEYERRRGNLQQIGAHSAHLTTQSIGDRFARWSADYLHRISKAIVREPVKNDCTPIAFKNLKHIRKRISNASNFQQWVFKEIQRYVECKAKEYVT